MYTGRIFFFNIIHNLVSVHATKNNGFIFNGGETEYQQKSNHITLMVLILHVAQLKVNLSLCVKHTHIHRVNFFCFITTIKTKELSKYARDKTVDLHKD